MDKLNSLGDLGASSEASTKPLCSEAGSDHVVDSCLDCNKNALLTCSWHQKNETTNSPIHEFKVLQNVF